MAWLTENAALILAVLFGMSEVLGMVPAIQANGIFQLVVGVLKQLKDAFVKK